MKLKIKNRRNICEEKHCSHGHKIYNQYVVASSIFAQSAITLIALIITIIVLLILAGITISLTVGQNGIIEKSQQSGIKNEEATAREKLQLALLDLQADKITNSSYNENEYIDTYLSNNQMVVMGDVVLVDGWQFQIDRTVPEIVASLGKVNQDFGEFELKTLEIDLKPTRNSISVVVSSINNTTIYLNSNVCEYRFSKDNGQTWTEYQNSPTYTFNNLYGDLEGATYTITVEAKDKKENIKQVSKSTKTKCLFTTYYRNTADETLLTASGRIFKKSNNEGAIAGLAVVKGTQNWLTVVLVSTNISAVEYYTNYSNTNISSLGSIEYNGITYYYSGLQERMPASSSYTTTLPILNGTTNVYDNMEDAVYSLLDRYFLETSYRNTADEVLCTIGNRIFKKTNSEEAIVGLAYLKGSTNWLGPVLVSTNPLAVEYYTNYSNTNFTFEGNVQYNGTTYYYSGFLENMPASNSYTTTLPVLNSITTIYDNKEDAVLDLLDKYYGVQ